MRTYTPHTFTLFPEKGGFQCVSSCLRLAAYTYVCAPRELNKPGIKTCVGQFPLSCGNRRTHWVFPARSSARRRSVARSYSKKKGYSRARKNKKKCTGGGGGAYRNPIESDGGEGHAPDEGKTHTAAEETGVYTSQGVYDTAVQQIYLLDLERGLLEAACMCYACSGECNIDPCW